MAVRHSGETIASAQARAFVIPTDAPEADGTLSWNKTTLITVHVSAAGSPGFGYTYADAAAASLINGMLAEHIKGANPFDIPGVHRRLQRAVRNVGRGGLAACAISAIDLALWDLKARLLGVGLGTLLGREREKVPIYGSGGFTTYDDTALQTQLSGWVARDGCEAVKMKIGSHPEDDPRRIALAGAAIGQARLFVDANGALTARAALGLAAAAAESDIAWFEEPVSSDDLAGLALVRASMRRGVDVAAGEYCFTLDDVRLMLQAGAVDVQQLDITRCGGITGFMKAAALAEAFHIPLSGHCAPSAHLHAACAAPGLRHLEWFHDHVRIEQRLFDGAPVAEAGSIRPDPSRPGNGLALKTPDAEAFAVV